MSKAKGIRAGRAFVELFADNSKLVKGLKAAQARLKTFGAGVRALGVKMLAIGGAITAPLVASLRHFEKVGDQLDKMAARTGLSTNALSELGFAAEQSGTSIEVVEKALREMQAKGMNPEQFEAVLDEIDAIEDPVKRAQKAFEVFGKKVGAPLLPLLGNVRALRKEARELGLSVDPADATAAADLNDAMNRVKRTFQAAAFQIGAALAPAMTSLANKVKTVFVAVRNWLKQNKQVVVSVGKLAIAIVAVGAGLAAAGTTIRNISTSLGLLAKTVGFLGGVLGFVLSPLGLITAAIAAGVTAWLRWTESGQQAAAAISQKFGQLLALARKTFGGIWDAIAGGDLALAGSIAMAGLRVTILSGLSTLANAVDGIWGGMVADIGMRMLGGDFRGAWETAVAAMSAAWATFSKFVVDGLSSILRALFDFIGEANKAFSRWAKRAGLDSLFAFDVVEKRREVRQEIEGMIEDAMTRRGELESRMQDIFAETGMKTPQLQMEFDALGEEITRLQGLLAELEDDPLMIGKAIQDDKTSLDAVLNPIENEAARAADEALRNLDKRVSDAPDRAADAAAAAAAELDRLRQQAAEMRKATEEQAGVEAKSMYGGMAGVEQKTGVGGSFSALAARRGLAAGDAADRTANAVEAIDAKMRELIREARNKQVFA